MLIADFKEKLDKVCRDNKLWYSIEASQYPITITIRPVTDDGQVRLPGITEKLQMDPKARVTFEFLDEMVIHTHEKFVLPEDVFNRIKGASKKFVQVYLQMFFEKQMSIKPVLVDTDTGELMEVEE